MKEKKYNIMEDDLSVDESLKIRKEAGLKIDPGTVTVVFALVKTLDPYGIHPELPEGAQQVSIEYFARSPESSVWVHFGDLPEEVREKLWEMHRSTCFIPPGLRVPWLEENPEPVTLHDCITKFDAFWSGFKDDLTQLNENDTESLLEHVMELVSKR